MLPSTSQHVDWNQSTRTVIVGVADSTGQCPLRLPGRMPPPGLLPLTQPAARPSGQTYVPDYFNKLE